MCNVSDGRSWVLYVMMGLTEVLHRHVKMLVMKVAGSVR